VNNEKALAVFENFKIRRIYDEKLETWYFSVVDIIAALVQQPEYQTARKYWNKLKERLKQERGQSVGDKLSPTETGGFGWKTICDRCC
jgi:hypothetical protein